MNNKKVTITRPFVSWYCECVYIIDPSRNGSLQVLHELESDMEDADKAWLYNVYVAKPFRGEGIATRLINAAKDYCRRKKYDKLFLWCYQDMIEFYEKFGFKNTGVIAEGGNHKPQHKMACDIPITKSSRNKK